MKEYLVTVIVLTVLELLLCTSGIALPHPKYNKRRSLRMGDTFTVSEMLPIAKRLMKKVGKLGGGKGIVSSAFHPQELTDRLFEAYFLTGKRIITLKDIDIAGLDAFQALALCGDEVMINNEYDSITESPNNKNGEHTINEAPIKCLYTLVSKPIENNDTVVDLPDSALGTSVQPQEAIQKVDFSKVGETLKVSNRSFSMLFKSVENNDTAPDILDSATVTSVQPQEAIQKVDFSKPGETLIVSYRRFSIREQANKKLGKKRKLIIKRRRHETTLNTKENKLNPSSKETNNTTEKSEKQKIESTTSAGLTKLTIVNEVCRWRYRCTEPADQRTCHVSPDCGMKKVDQCFGDKDVENTKTMQNFRRMIGIDPIDEEVEKILERHVLQVRTYVKGGLESGDIGRYVNSLMMKESKKAAMITTAMPKENEAAREK